MTPDFCLRSAGFRNLTLEDWRLCFEREGAEEDLRLALRGSELVKWQFRGVAQTGLMVPRNYPGQKRARKQMHWSTETIFRVLEAHEPNHPLLEEAYRQATSDFSRCGRSQRFSRSGAAFRLAIARTAGGLAIFLPDLCQQNQRNHDAGRSGRGGGANLSRVVCPRPANRDLLTIIERIATITMMKFKDHFSGHAAEYAKFRPTLSG